MGGVQPPLFLMLGAVVLVLGIGCANVASLLLARGIEREREFAIRSALGAGRARLVRQLVAESLLLSAIAAACGVALARWGIAGIVALAPSGVLRLHEASIDGRVLLIAAASHDADGGGVRSAAGAAVLAARARSDARAAPAAAPRRGFRRGLVAAEVAFALVLLTGAGLLVRSFDRLIAVDPGFSAGGRRRGAGVRLRTAMPRPNGRATSSRRRSSGFARFRACEAAGAVSAMPFAPSNINIRSALDIVGRPAASEREQRGAYVTIATPGYFEAMSIPLREGRLLRGPRRRARADRRADQRRAAPARVARRDAGRQAHRRAVARRRVEAEVVGVVSEIRHDGLDSVAARPKCSCRWRSVPFGSMTYVVRADGEPAGAHRRRQTRDLGGRSAADVLRCGAPGTPRARRRSCGSVSA